MAIADSDNIRGGRRWVDTKVELYTLTGQTDQLKTFVTVIRVDDENQDYLLVDIDNVDNEDGWKIHGFKPIAENEAGTHPEFTDQHTLNLYLLGLGQSLYVENGYVTSGY